MGFFDQQRASWMPSSLMAGGTQPTMPSPELQAVAPPQSQGLQASFMGSQPGLMSSGVTPWLEGGGNTFSGGSPTPRDPSRDWAESIANREGWNNTGWGSIGGRVAGGVASLAGAPIGVGAIPGLAGRAWDQYGVLNPALEAAGRQPNTWKDYFNFFSSPTGIAMGRLQDEIKGADAIVAEQAYSAPRQVDPQMDPIVGFLDQLIGQGGGFDGGGRDMNDSPPGDWGGFGDTAFA